MSRRYLARAGLTVAVVASPAATLGALAGRAADLFAIDLTMPSLDLIAVRRALAEGDPVPVVFLLDRQGRRPRGLAGCSTAATPPRCSTAWWSRW